MSPTSGGTTGTPVSGGAPGTSIAQPYPHTLLSVDYYAKILGINPMHFNSGSTPGLNPIVMPHSGQCNDIWYKYDWQAGDRVGRYQLAEVIHSSEEEIASVVGYYPAPQWIEQEVHPYPRVFARDLFGSGLNVRGRAKEFATKYGKLVQPGERALTLIGTATTIGGTLVYSDDDGDGFFETATVTMATTLTDEREIKAYFTGFSGALEWQIRPARSNQITGGNVVIKFDSWLLIDPELHDFLPTDDGVSAIDISTVANFVTSVDVYREYIDTTQAAVIFYWEAGRFSGTSLACPSCGTIGCSVCAYESQNGCLIARDYHNSLLTAYPATYDSENEQWNASAWLECIEPDLVKVSYLAGNQSQEFLQRRSSEPLSLFWAQAIAWLATARLDRPLCTCGAAQDLANYLSEDLAHFTRGETHFITPDILNCPFGTRRGEVMAWRRIKSGVPDKRLRATVI